MIRRPPRSTPFPSPTLFRSVHECAFAQHRQQKACHGKIRLVQQALERGLAARRGQRRLAAVTADAAREDIDVPRLVGPLEDRKSTRLNSSHQTISFASFYFT